MNEREQIIYERVWHVRAPGFGSTEEYDTADDAIRRVTERALEGLGSDLRPYDRRVESRGPKA